MRIAFIMPDRAATSRLPRDALRQGFADAAAGTPDMFAPDYV